jgi:hypothetical protein
MPDYLAIATRSGSVRILQCTACRCDARRGVPELFVGGRNGYLVDPGTSGDTVFSFSAELSANDGIVDGDAMVPGVVLQHEFHGRLPVPIPGYRLFDQ